MASGKVARRAVGSEISALLDSTEIAALIQEIDASGDARGRKGYGARALVGACLVKALYGLPTWTRVAALIGDHASLQTALGGTPSVWACYRFTTKLREHSDKLADCLDRIAAALCADLPGIGCNVAIDGTDLAAFANGQRYVSSGGKERERFSDPDASWGHRSAVSTRKGGGFYGYKLHLAVCTRTGLPLAWSVQTARRHESMFVAEVLDAVRARGFAAMTCAMDKGYDSDRVHQECANRDCKPIIAATRNRRTFFPLPVARDSEPFRRLYRDRSAVEREFGRLKHDYGLAPLRVRGLARVQLHADLTILARLSLALVRARAVLLAA
jgi:IS5 family transposase